MEGSKITGIRDVDKLILSNMDTRTFLNTYQIKNKYIHSLFDENVFKNRVQKEFPRLINLKINRLWKKYYFDLIYWSNKIKEEYSFESNDFRAHPKRYFDLLSKLNKLKDSEHLKRMRDIFTDLTIDVYKLRIMNEILSLASKDGYIDLIKFVIDKGANNYRRALNSAAYTGQLEAFEYLRNNVLFDYDLTEALDYTRDGMRIRLSHNNTEMIEHIQSLIKNK